MFGKRAMGILAPGKAEKTDGKGERDNEASNDHFI